MFRLEQKLADVHATDVKALDRAHKALCQHVDALEVDAKARGMHCHCCTCPAGQTA